MVKAQEAFQSSMLNKEVNSIRISNEFKQIIIEISKSIEKECSIGGFYIGFEIPLHQTEEVAKHLKENGYSVFNQRPLSKLTIISWGNAQKVAYE